MSLINTLLLILFFYNNNPIFFLFGAPIKTAITTKKHKLRKFSGVNF